MRIKSSRNYTQLILFGLGLVIVVGLLAFQYQTESKDKKHDLLVPEVSVENGLPTIQITVKEKHYRKLKTKRNEALADGILETADNDYVPAIVSYNNVPYPAEIRLKGDWTDHLRGDKWSYRIKLENDQTIMGMRKFSIHHPKTRGYVNEWLYHKANKAEDLMALRYSFAEGFISVNMAKTDSVVTNPLGIYAIEESFDKRTIESNRRKEGVILRISEAYFWKEVKQAWQVEKQTGYRPNSNRQPRFQGSGNEYVSSFGMGRIFETEALKKQFTHAKNLLELFRQGELTTSQVFDVEKLALFTALNNLFCGYHGMAAINSRFYYNPTTSKLDPVAYDANAGQKLTTFRHYLFTNRLVDPEYDKALIMALERMTQKSYLDNLFGKFYKEAAAYEKALIQEFGKSILINKENYYYNQEIMRQELERLNSLYDDA